MTDCLFAFHDIGESPSMMQKHVVFLVMGQPPHSPLQYTVRVATDYSIRP